MTSKTNLFITSLFGITLVYPAFAATNATQDWVRNNYYSKSAINTLNSNFIRVRDSVFLYDADPNSPTRGEILNSLNTNGTNAFDGINEVLEKVDGNNGTAGTAVELQTTSQNAYGAINEVLEKVNGNDGTAGSAIGLQTTSKNAYGAINELKGEISGKAAQADLQTLTDKVNDASTGLDTKASKSELEALSQTVDGLQGNTYGGSNGVRVVGNTVGLSVTPEVGEMYIYTSNGWKKLPIDDTWN